MEIKMEFEEMQVIWNEQNNEKMFAINEAALHKYIKGKSRSVNHLMQFAEWAMIAGNLLVVIILTWDAINEGGPTYQYFIAGMYLVYSVVGLIRRLLRKQAEIVFEPTILGEVDKALWQVNYLIRQSKSLVYWYIIPLTVVVSSSFLLNGKYGWAVLFLLVLIPASLLGSQWETNKLYLGKKRELEQLRATLS
jgi:hypothetical protein